MPIPKIVGNPNTLIFLMVFNVVYCKISDIRLCSLLQNDNYYSFPWQNIL